MLLSDVSDLWYVRAYMPGAGTKQASGGAQAR
jgi:hypothetical protein